MVQRKISVVQAGLACCGLEAASVDLVGSAIESINVEHLERNEEALKHILVIAGTLTHALVDGVAQMYETLPDPRVVVAFGACAISGGPYWDSYSVVKGAGCVIPVDIHVPGCPPTPEDLSQALVQAIEIVHNTDTSQGVTLVRP